MNKINLTVIILTFNEEKHIKRCINNVRSIANKIYVIDSFSNDNTVKIANSMGANVIQHQFINYSHQLNWALKNLSIETDWVMRLDADEHLSQKLIKNLQDQLNSTPSVITGIIIDRKIIYYKKRINFGGFGSNPMLRIWRNGLAICESRWMDEHMILTHGKSKRISGELFDENLNNISWWTKKHLKYASREAIDLLNIRYGFIKQTSKNKLTLGNTKIKRTLKEQFYSRLPLGFRTILYFIYRMFFLGGFLDGPKGWSFIFFQGLWYRLIVDIKIMEVEKQIKQDSVTIIDAIISEFGINPIEMNSLK